LDEYRRSFDDAYQSVIRTLRDLGFEPTGRPAKSTISIVAKLRRESIRLSQVQDIAGCRLVVPTILEQEKSLEVLRTKLADATVVDRRKKSSHGYRAIHVIPHIDGIPVEVQLRTSLQHLWAELSEKLSDLRDPSIKYGGGPRAWQIHLQKLSGLSSIVEDYQLLLTSLGPHQVLDLGSFEANRQQLQNNISEFIAISLSMPDIREESEWAKIEALLLASYENPKRTKDQDN
jgi:hypothetical protein